MTQSQTASTTATDDDRRWDALTHRRPESKYAFIYAVRTTGIYCRPTCSSRLPRRRNVEFFDTSVDAELVGYRPCKRCRPRSPVLEDSRVALVRRACRSMESVDGSPPLERLAAEAGLSPSRFHRVFRELTGATPKQYADAIQSVRVRDELHRERSVTDAVYAAGFGSSSRFYEKWAWILGMKPATYGSGGAGELIVFAIVNTHLGAMLVATTRIGLCSIAFGDDPGELEQELRRRFEKATVVEGDTQFRDWVDHVAGEIETTAGFQDLPLDIQGTAFMQRVWSALQQIPSGQTRSYAEVAESIGNPHAARAVASACAKNALALAIPCHRVVCHDGSPGGYRWGAERKQTLLEQERG